jgi:hypothetical protein
MIDSRTERPVPQVEYIAFAQPAIAASSAVELPVRSIFGDVFHWFAGVLGIGGDDT